MQLIPIKVYAQHVTLFLSDRIDRIKMHYKGADLKVRENVAAAMSSVPCRK